MSEIARIIALVASLTFVSCVYMYLWNYWPFRGEHDESLSYPPLSTSDENAKIIYRSEDNSNSIFGQELFDSGYIHVGETYGEMFYWLTPARENEDNKPLVAWLTGGPGCSSEMAALSENGPWWIQDDGVVKNKFAWTEAANVIYIDQPLGTGFSIAKDPRNFVIDEKKIAEHMKQFFTRFLIKYPEFVGRAFFLTGESYAGHYIPSIAHHLMRHPIEGLNLKGIAIGNGWVDPNVQYPAYADFAYENKLINRKEYLVAKAGYSLCTKLIQTNKWPLAMVQCQASTEKLLKGLNPYDIRLKCDVPPLCYNQTNIFNFLNREDVQKELGVRTQWESCDALVHVLLVGDWVKDMIHKVADILENGYRVLIYNGDKDFICNWFGGKDWTERVQWRGQRDFVAKQMEEWEIDGKPAGQIKAHDNFAFVRVYDAGHMVPMDKPQPALALIKEFISNEESINPNAGPISVEYK